VDVHLPVIGISGREDRLSTSIPRNETLYVTKECSEYTGEAGSFWTIASWNFDAIPIS